LNDLGVCIACNDATNCNTCSNSGVAQCTACNENYSLFNGICKLTSLYDGITQTGGIVSTISFDGNLDAYTALGGNNYFAYLLATALSVDISRIEVISAKQGSVIIIYKVYTVTGSAESAEELAARITAYTASGALNLYGTTVTSYGSSYISVSGCPDGTYLDAYSVCQACPDGCDTCTSGSDKCGVNVGAIVGGVIGGVALVVIIVIIYLKRESIKKMVSPKSYNKVASTPTNVAQKA